MTLKLTRLLKVQHTFDPPPDCRGDALPFSLSVTRRGRRGAGGRDIETDIEERKLLSFWFRISADFLEETMKAPDAGMPKRERPKEALLCQREVTFPLHIFSLPLTVQNPSLIFCLVCFGDYAVLP